MKEYLFQNFHFKYESGAMLADHHAEYSLLFQVWSPLTPHSDFCQYSQWTPFSAPGCPTPKFNADNFQAIALATSKSPEQWDQFFHKTLLDKLNSYLLTDIDWCQIVVLATPCSQTLYLRSSTHTDELVSEIRFLLT